MVNRKSTLPAVNSSRLVDGVELSTTIQDAGCAWMTLVGESLHLLGLSSENRRRGQMLVAVSKRGNDELGKEEEGEE